MTEEDRRLAVLAAALARERAPALLARLGGPDGEAARLARDLAGASREERLRALAAVLAEAGAAARARSSGRAGAERPRVAAVLGAVAAGVPGRGPAGLLVRLCRERLAR